MKHFIFPLLLLISFSVLAQSADFIILKKKNKTLQTFYAGKTIAFTTTTGTHIQAQINAIKNDTLFLQEFIIRYLPTTFGAVIKDTAGSYSYKLNYRQIKIIDSKPQKGFDKKSNGAVLLGGGLALTIANGVVFLADRNKFSAPLLISSAALGTVGYFLSKSNRNGYVIDKKYTLLYMNMSLKKM